MEKMRKIIKATCHCQEEERLFLAVVRQTRVREEFLMDPYYYADPMNKNVFGFCFQAEIKEFSQKYIWEILYCLNKVEESLSKPLPKDSSNLPEWYARFALTYIARKVVEFNESTRVEP